MKTVTIVQTATVLTIAILSNTAHAHGDSITTGNRAASLVTEVLYDNPAYNRGVHSYPNPVAPKLIAKDHIVYIDKAHGQAVYSYPRNTQ